MRQHVRSVRARRHLPLKAARPEATSMSPDEMVTQSQLDARLGLAIGKLSERLRLVVTMLYEEGVSQRESANRLGITEGRFSQLRG
jgi:RNA polymerase sigma factor (sigma-70 family)